LFPSKHFALELEMDRHNPNVSSEHFNPLELGKELAGMEAPMLDSEENGVISPLCLKIKVRRMREDYSASAQQSSLLKEILDVKCAELICFYSPLNS